MRTRMKKLLVALLALVMIFTGTSSMLQTVEATTDDSSIQIKFTNAPDYTVKPGETTHLTYQVQTTSSYALNPDITAAVTETVSGTKIDSTLFKFSNITLKTNGTAVKSIANSYDTTLEMDVTASDEVKIGNYSIAVKIKFTDNLSNPYTSNLTATLKVQEEKAPAQLTVGSAKLTDSSIGSKTDLSFKVKNEGEITAKSVYVAMTLGDSFEAGYTSKSIKVGDLAADGTQLITLPITILSSATTGRKTITANFTYKTTDGTEKTSTYDIYVTLTAASNTTQLPKLSIGNITYKEGLEPGDDFALTVNLENVGGAQAKDIKVTVDPTSISDSGIIKDYFTEGIAAENMSAEEEASVNIPLTVSKYATGGLKSVKVIVTYSDASGVSYTATDSVYVDIAATATPTPVVENPNILITNVKQSPAQPQAGEKVEVSFDVKNKSKVDAKELKLYTEGLTSTTFIPVNAEPYQYFETLKAGQTVRVTIPLIVSETVVEGLNSITVKYTYTGGDGSVSIPVKDVQNDNVSISKPKIIVSKYSTDVEELRAGNTFNFTFDLYNTNSTVTAKNITVTISQADNVFAVTQGSNSFFIEKIGPGESVTNTLEMKVKSDATTKAYPLELTIEYEYDGAEPNPTTGEIGETKTEKLNLQAVENARPVINNTNVYSWDGAVMVGTTATLAFEFYNMGKSQLNNVIVYVEGDFTKADGDMYFIGNVAAGSSSYVEFDVIPNMEGTASGNLRLTFEDSNGETVEVMNPFTAEVMSAAVIDPGVIDGGSGEVFNPEVPMAKAAILPVWAFVLIQIAIFVIFVPVTRKIIISVHKAKMIKKEQDQY